MGPTVHFWIPADRPGRLSGGISGKEPEITTPITATDIMTGDLGASRLGLNAGAHSSLNY